MRKLLLILLIVIFYDCTNTINNITDEDFSLVYGIEAINSNTISVYNSDKSKIYQVTIYGIEGPGSRYEDAAKKNLTELINNQNFELKNISKVEEDRVVAEVYFSKKDLEVADLVLMSGLATASDKSSDKNYLNAQIIGMNSRKGIWSNPDSFIP